MKKIQFKKMLSNILVLTVILAFVSCKSSALNNSVKSNTDSRSITPVQLISKSSGEISVMAFNVENMFDSIHNEGVGDYAYLPVSQKNTQEVKDYCNTLSGFYKSDCYTKDWSDEAVDFKLSQVAKIITYVDNGQGPDNLILSEVENENILKMLVNKHLSKFGYKTVSILKGPDPRGINTAFISKFPQIGISKLHLIPYTDAGGLKSRGILETTVKINNKSVSFLAAHFPSQSNPSFWRKEAFEHMRKIMLESAKNGKAIIGGGDLNTVPEEDSKDGYFSKILSEAADVSHLVDCKTCEGTHSYRGQWSFLDVIAFGKNLLQDSGLSLIPGSIYVVKTPVNMKPNGTPLRFDENKKEGVSDHFPIYSRLKINTLTQ